MTISIIHRTKQQVTKQQLHKRTAPFGKILLYTFTSGTKNTALTLEIILDREERGLEKGVEEVIHVKKENAPIEQWGWIVFQLPSIYSSGHETDSKILHEQTHHD